MTVEEETRRVVESYFAAWTTKDVRAAHALLAGDLEFSAPTASYQSADAFLPALVKFAEMTKWARIVDLVVDGNRAALLYDCELPQPVGKLRIASFFASRREKSACTKRCSTPRSFASFKPASAPDNERYFCYERRRRRAHGSCGDLRSACNHACGRACLRALLHAAGFQRHRLDHQHGHTARPGQYRRSQLHVPRPGPARRAHDITVGCAQCIRQGRQRL